MRQLVAFLYFQRTYWSRREELLSLQEDLDRRAAR
jgi:hypothetical protein